MISDKMLEALNKQTNAELYSGYMYLSMSAYFESVNLRGFANWMRVQANEELSHGLKFYDYIVERGGRAKLLPIEQPPLEWSSPLEAFEEVYKHEVKVTGLINNLVKTAISEKDYATQNMLQWFVAEQVEEEASADEVIQRIKLAGSDGKGLLLIDRELAQRKSE